MYFLSQDRRAALISTLTHGLSMPRILAEDYSSISDSNLVVIDRHISGCVGRIIQCHEQLQEQASAHNHERADVLLIMMAGDVVMLAAYCAEAAARRIPKLTLPRTVKALNASTEELAGAVAMVLANSVTVQ